jgi:hypothetical protein
MWTETPPVLTVAKQRGFAQRVSLHLSLQKCGQGVGIIFLYVDTVGENAGTGSLPSNEHLQSGFQHVSLISSLLISKLKKSF